MARGIAKILSLVNEILAIFALDIFHVLEHLGKAALCFSDRSGNSSLND